MSFARRSISSCRPVATESAADDAAGDPARATAPEPGREQARHPWRPSAFVCEDDVRRAMQAGTTILLGEKTIVTPVRARSRRLAHNVFAPAGWPR